MNLNLNDYEKKHNDMLRGFGAECTVLLQSDGTFPLEAPSSLALYGSGARHTIKGGTGSGEVNSRYFVTAEDGLEAAGFRILTKGWMDSYSAIYKEQKKRFIKQLKRAAIRRGTLAIISDMGAVMPEPEYDLPLDAEADAAIYVLSRISGEGSDRKPVAGDILLTETEKRDILALEKKFSRFMLVLNVGGVVDLTPVMEVRNILYLSQLGVETGNILADIVLGKSTPSGKLTTTWSAWNDYQNIGDFGDRFDTNYKEGIYVGYRYFDSIRSKPLFPFGYGLSYTTFDVRAGGAAQDDGNVSVKACVENTGKTSGKEVVQLYVSSPSGKLDKPYQALAAFAKTKELKAGEEQTLTLSFDIKDLASYDESRSAWILEPGDYVLRLGNSSRSTQPVAVMRLDEEVVVRKVKNCLGKPAFEDWKPETISRENLPSDLPLLELDASSFVTETVDYNLNHEIDPIIEGLSDSELCLMNIGSFGGKGSKSVVGEAAQSVVGGAGETTLAFIDKGIPSIVMADGPSGIRISRQYTRDEDGVHPVGQTMPESVMELMPAPAAFFMKLFEKKGPVRGTVYEQNCTAIPIGTALAQSWNTDLAVQCGDIVGDEMERFGVHLWLAPALNIHRDIRCGRNYEYFSEDPLVSGCFSAAITCGVQKHPGCGTTIKHFAANNQETNRYGSNSVVSERAMREIYLKGFGIAVRDSQPHALMTSYNLINGVHTSERRDLAEDILRAEFGFKGIVMTDWIIGALNFGKKKYPAPDAARIAAAGNDLVMPGGPADYKAMLKGLKEGRLTRDQLLVNATRVYRIAKLLKSGF